MSKIRVRDLAKELNKSSREIIQVLKMHGVVVESHTSMLPENIANRIRSYYKGASADKTGKKPAVRPARPEGRPAAQKRPAPAAGGLDENGNFSMPAGGFSFDGRSDADKRMAEKKNAEKEARKAAAKPVLKPEAEPAPEVKPEAAEKAPEISVEVKPEIKPEVKAEEKPEVKVEDKPEVMPVKDAETKPEEKKETKPEAKAERKPVVTSAKEIAERAERLRKQQASERSQGRDGQGRGGRDGQGRGPARDGQGRGGRDGQSRGPARDGQSRGPARDGQSRGPARDGQGRGPVRDNRDNQARGGAGNRQGSGGRNAGRGFNLDREIKSEVAPGKDSSRENRRNFNKDRDNRRDERLYEDKENTKNAKGGKQAAKKNQHKKPAPAPKKAPVEEKITSVTLPEEISLKDFADLIKVPATQIIKKLFMAGKMVNLNSDITYEEAEEIALEYDILCEHEVVVDVIEEMLKEEEENEEDMITRPPVVCVMGHVDHGKTSILDAIRKTRVTAGEAGGITQHIGAYVVEVNGQKITFLDTPGHEAFTAMRLRGAQSTDIAILVVAADDGVMPQTIEAINHAKAAGIDIIVAINKIDKPSANIDRVKQELTEYGLVAEDWGGQTIMVPVSAHTGEGLSDLLDMILLDAEVKELKANPNRKGRGLILEAQLDKGRGPVATVLVQKGTLNVGDHVTVGTAYGRIRAMIDDTGRRVKKAGPSTPVEILGLNEVPNAGDVFIATETEKEARSMAETFIATNREKMLAETKSRLSLDSLFEQIQEGQIKDLNIIVKADVQGSVEAVKQSLAKLSNEEVAVKVIHGGVGAINESDVTLASASNAIIIGFNVRPDNQAKAVAEQENVDMRLYRVIYNAIEDIQAAMKGMLEPTFQEKIIGHAEVRQTYKVSGVGTIIGGYVQDGKIVRGCKVRLLRDNVVIHDGELASLKRFKDDVKEVNTGYECGMSFEKYNDIKEGDQIEAYVMEEVPR